LQGKKFVNFGGQADREDGSARIKIGGGSENGLKPVGWGGFGKKAEGEAKLKVRVRRVVRWWSWNTGRASERERET